MNIQQLIALGGMIGPILYTMIWILGGILQPGYSHIRDDVSSLLAVGARAQLLLFTTESFRQPSFRQKPNDLSN